MQIVHVYLAKTSRTIEFNASSVSQATTTITHTLAHTQTGTHTHTHFVTTEKEAAILLGS